MNAPNKGKLPATLQKLFYDLQESYKGVGTLDLI